MCLRVIAHDYLWLYFAAKGGKGSKKMGFKTSLRSTYSTLCLVVVHKSGQPTGDHLNTAVVENELWEVIKSFPHRASSKRYAQA